MSHELRSPLNAILGFAQLMELEQPAPKPEQKDRIDQILHAGWHLLSLINEILDLAKIESGQVPLSMEPVSLAEMMLECQSMTDPIARKYGIEMIFPLFEPLYFVSADRTRLKQVLINLLSNAIKYNLKSGKVEASFAQISPGRMRISIRDTGAGLSAEELSQLFKPFQRLGQEAGGVEGTGIGLVVARQLVELMGGEIGVDSKEGEGSIFWFELNEVAPSVVNLSGERISSVSTVGSLNPKRKQTLLYVEDNPTNMKLVEMIISRYPQIQLLKALDGSSGIAMAQNNLPDVILMDINLPGMSGLEVLKTLKADPKTSYIPVVALSANAMSSDIKKGMLAGFFRYLTKPIVVIEFMDTLNTAFEYSYHSGGR